MKTERFEQVDRIFQAAVERDPADRQAYIDEACGDDAELRSRVEALLSADERAGTFIETPAYRLVSEMTEERSRTMMGQLIGPYRVASPLGVGGMGEVYLAEDLRLGRKVALKLLASHSIGDSQLRGRFLREARLASTLDHQNICTIYEVGEDSGHSYIAMQYVEGKTLKELIDRQPLGLKSLFSISLQVAAALEAAHSQGIIHRDIKPGNIMVTPRGQAKVLDFGLAKLMDESEAIASEESRELTRTGAVMGTPSYMSPEQARGERADHRSDIFSFGVVMYLMATGRLPFKARSQAETMNAVINDGHTPVAELNQEAPSGLSAVIDRALAKEPADRYQSITAMIAELRQVAQEAQVITSSEPDDLISPYVPVRERDRFGRLRQLMKPALGASLLFLLALAAALIWWQPWRLTPSRPQQHLISTFPGNHRAASFSPDGSMIAFISDADGVPQVWVKNLAQGDPVQITFGEIPAQRPRWSPSNDQIVFGRGTSTSSPEIWSVPPLGGTQRKVIEGGRNPNWSWDGSQLVYEKGDDVWTAKADGSAQRKLEGLRPIEFHLGDRMPAYSRDGSQIAFFQNTAGPLGDIWVIPSAGGQPRQLTSDITISSAPVWLADDRYIVYSSQRAGSTTLWKVPTSGGKPEPVLISPGEDTDPEVSRDGTKLIYTNTRNSYVITQMNPATKQTQELREARNLYCDPSFSPQGDKIAFFGMSDDGESHIFILGVDGHSLKQVTREKGAQNSFPSWSPDGLDLYFSQHRPMPSLQKISIEGGPSSEIAPGWSWDICNGVQVDPTGKLLVCSKMENGETVATIIREIESGNETVFGIPLRYPRWSADRKWILGTSRSASKFRGWVGEISICSVETGTCRQLTKDSKCPRWYPDGSRVFFLRSGKVQYEEELWSISVTGEDEKQIAKLQMHEISSYYDVSSKGEIVYVRFNPGRHELWLLDFHNP